MKCGEWTAGVREQSVFLPSSVNNITFSSLPDCLPDSLEAANSVGLKKVVGGRGAGRRNPPRRALNVDPNGRNFIPRDCLRSLSHSLSRLPIEVWGGAGKLSPSLLLFNTCFSTLSLLPFPSTQQDSIFFYLITRKSPLTGGASPRRCPMSTRSLSQ